MQRLRATVVGLALFLSCTAWAGCGGKEAAAVPVDLSKPFATGFDPEHRLSQLTPGELGQACASAGRFLQASADRSLEINCRSTAIFTAKGKRGASDAEIQARCQAVYDDCTRTPHWRVSETCGTPAASCTATVADIEGCVNTEVGYFSKLGADLPTCAQVTAATIDALPAGIDATKLAACDPLGYKCPGLEFLGGH